MENKDLTTSIIVAGLTIIFALVSFALYLSKGKSKFWTAKKMKLGAIILTFTTVASTQQSCTSCYVPVIEDEINIYLNDTLRLKDSTNLHGNIYSRTKNNYSFKLQNDTIDSLIQKGNIIPDDGTFDTSQEKFTINIDTLLQTGKYRLSFYGVEKEKQGDENLLHSTYSINILNEK